MKNIFLVIIAVMTFTTSFSQPFGKLVSGGLKATYLRCEYLVDPLGIDIAKPELSWYCTSAKGNEKQMSYRILVASSIEKLNSDEGDLWDSKQVFSSQSIGINYNGLILHSGVQCFWKVKVWDANGDESGWSEPAKWSMGLLNKSDWKGYWIGLDSLIGTDNLDSIHTRLSARYLRKEFVGRRKIRRATAYICGLGLFELYFNGKKIGDQVLAPALSQYSKRSFYMTFDVTREIKEGQNAIGVVLGNGRFVPLRGPIPPETQQSNSPRMIFQLNIEYTDGTKQEILSDKKWKITARGPILANNEYDGETYDARKQMPGWNKAGFNDSDWIQTETVEAPSRVLSAQMTPPIRVTQDIKPESVKEIRPGVYVYDMGQNMAGWVSLKIRAKRGTKFILKFAETVKPNGELDMQNLRTARQTDVFIANGKGLEEWQPHFVYHGFRYVELTGFAGTPGLNTITGKVVHDDLRTTGQFSCSNETINRVYKAAYWTIRDNYRSIPTDCPQRDERRGWFGDRSISSLGESFIFDNNTFYTKWLTDIEDAQKPDGSLPDLAPDYDAPFTDNISWPSSFVMIPNNLYEQFGNKKVIAEHYDAMKKWLSYMRNKYMVHYLMPKNSYGDWCRPPQNPIHIHSRDTNNATPDDYIGSTYFYYCLTLMEKYARLLNKDDDEEQFKLLREKVLNAINKVYLSKDSSFYANNTVTANVLALSFGIPPNEQVRSRVFENVVAKTAGAYKNHTSCGLIGQQWLMRTLTHYGKPDLALTLAANTTYPSFGYMLKNGATTIWELWNANTALPDSSLGAYCTFWNSKNDSGISNNHCYLVPLPTGWDPLMVSHNHVMLLGDFIPWLYQDIAGIRSDPLAPGYKHIIMKPYLEGDLKYVRCSFMSPHGKIESNWDLTDSTFSWQIQIPANTTASIYIPAGTNADVKESGRHDAGSGSARYLRTEKGRAIYELGSGEYRFISRRR